MPENCFSPFVRSIDPGALARSVEKVFSIFYLLVIPGMSL